METVDLELPGGGSVSALRLQDLPAEHVIAFMGMPPGMKEQMGVRLFQMALGRGQAEVLSGMILVTAVSEAAGESRDWKDDISVNLVTENRIADGVRFLDWEIQVTW
jgi:hypothetical protein